MATIPAYAMRDLRFLLREVRAMDRPDLTMRAEKIQKFIAPRRRAARPLLEECGDCDGCGWVEGGETLKTTCKRCGGSGTVAPPTARDRKAIRKTLQKIADEKLHRDVMARPGWRCELGAHTPNALWPIELHHLVAGAAKRALQNVTNCLRACTACHREWHRKGAERFRLRVLAWCVQWSYPIPPIFRRPPR